MNKKSLKELIGVQLLFSKAMNELPLRVKVQHIFLKNDPKNNAKILATAEAILKRAKNKEDFSKLAKTYSQDTKTKDSGGDLGWVSRGKVVVCGAVSNEFDNAVIKLNSGDIAGPIKTKCGYHIVKINGKEGWIDKSFEDWLKDLKNKTKVWKFIK